MKGIALWIVFSFFFGLPLPKKIIHMSKPWHVRKSCRIAIWFTLFCAVTFPLSPTRKKKLKNCGRKQRPNTWGRATEFRLETLYFVLWSFSYLPLNFFFLCCDHVGANHMGDKKIALFCVVIALFCVVRFILCDFLMIALFCAMFSHKIKSHKIKRSLFCVVIAWFCVVINLECE